MMPVVVSALHRTCNNLSLITFSHLKNERKTQIVRLIIVVQPRSNRKWLQRRIPPLHFRGDRSGKKECVCLIPRKTDGARRASWRNRMWWIHSHDAHRVFEDIAIRV
ncbi:unnamed protein product [Sphacelaria rigidula]